MTPLDREWIDRCSYCRQCTGVDLGEGCTPSLPPPPLEMTCGLLIQLVFCKIKNVTSQLVVQPLLRKIRDLPLV